MSVFARYTIFCKLIVIQLQYLQHILACMESFGVRQIVHPIANAIIIIINITEPKLT